MSQNFITCIRAGKKPLIEGSIKKKCYKCKNDVWVSPATLLSIKEGLYKGKIICVNCLVRKKEDDNERSFAS